MKTLESKKVGLRVSALKLVEGLDVVAGRAFESIVYREGLFKLKGWRARLGEVGGVLVVDVYLQEDGVWEGYFMRGLVDFLCGGGYEVCCIFSADGVVGGAGGGSCCFSGGEGVFGVRVFVGGDLVVVYEVARRG